MRAKNGDIAKSAVIFVGILLLPLGVGWLLGVRDVQGLSTVVIATATALYAALTYLLLASARVENERNRRLERSRIIASNTPVIRVNFLGGTKVAAQFESVNIGTVLALDVRVGIKVVHRDGQTPSGIAWLAEGHRGIMAPSDTARLITLLPPVSAPIRPSISQYHLVSWYKNLFGDLFESVTIYDVDRDELPIGPTDQALQLLEQANQP